ncbi:MAG: hypothetical protein IKN94_02325 [Salinivirgaceae bacterium]|nr:hypothetical protein [Salinivirgaceae bacterium]
MAGQAKKTGKRRIAWNRVLPLLLIPTLIVLAIRKLPDAFHHRKSIDEVAVAELSAKEVRALRRYNNEYHLEVARARGIDRPFKNHQHLLNDKYGYIVKYGLREVHDCKYYEVPALTYSMPYLKKEAVDFLDELGRRFFKSLKDIDVQEYRFQLSSVLRTEADQHGLRKENINATQNKTSHYFGLSFDIAQTCFYPKGQSEPVYSYRLRNLLLRNLIEMQDEGRCYVILETQTKCIHVTVR